MTLAGDPNKKLFVLDTNVLMHDPTAIFRFQEHHLFIPMVVLEELDRAKKGLSEVARNVRQVSHFLDDLVSRSDTTDINNGIDLSTVQYANRIDRQCSGHLFFQTRKMDALLPESFPGEMPDNSILGTVTTLKKEHSPTQVVLVSKDINLRIKAAVLGIRAEDYHSDQVLEDIDLLYRGSFKLQANFWESQNEKIDSWKENNRTFYRVKCPLCKEWFPNAYLYLDGESNFEAVVRSCDRDQATIELIQDFRQSKHSVWGVQARNREQNFALNALLDPQIDIVTLTGTAGTGKTLLAIAAGLSLTLDQKQFREIIMTRETIPVGSDIGFLPGSEEEKMTPWMGALLDNLEMLSIPENDGDWERNATNNIIFNRVKVRSLNFMRGRTFLNRYIILDEAQNLTPKQMKTLITRAGPGTKIICIGNLAQIDSPYLTGTTSGLTYTVDLFKHWAHSAHITLQRRERSRLADFASAEL